MDYFEILKKAWKVTWRYKALWVLGLFAAAGSGSSGSSSGNSSYQESSDYTSGTVDQFTRWAESNIVLIAVVIGLLVVIGIVWWVLSIAAQAGLVHGVNEAEEGRAPSLKGAWSVGFGKWGRTFMIGLVVALPIILVGGVMTALLVALGVGGAAAGGDTGVGALVGGLCLVVPLFILVIVVLAVVLGIVFQLALRYGVLDDVTFGQAVKRGWADVWAKRGAFVFWLVMLLPGIAYGVVSLIVAIPFAVPAVLLFMNGKYVIGGGLLVLFAIVMMLPMSIYSTFVSAAWTIFFRQMSGRVPQLEVRAPRADGMTAAFDATPLEPPVYAPPAPPVPDAPPVVEFPETLGEPPIAEAPPAPVTFFEPPAAPAPEPPSVPAAPDTPETPPADA